MKNLALIVAAGKGKRFGGEVVKQYELLGGKPILQHSIEAFLNHPKIDDVLVVINEQHLYLFEALNVPVKHCFGGDERQDSVRIGLQNVKDASNILIHDAARPYVSRETIDNVLNGLRKHDAVTPIIDSKDSARYQGVAINRDELKFVQTPQGFKYNLILNAHNNVDKIYTDDAQIFEAVGGSVHFVEGDINNRKITMKEDLQKREEARIGHGYDVHAFTTGTYITLCGIKIHHTHGLKGHSDADVALHAITDAVLGAIGEGDIGEHFLPSSDEWKDANSEIFLKKAAELVANKNGKISNIDVTIICEKPKLTEYKMAMKENVAKILQLRVEQINVKATTTEKLGFTGREEGISAHAVASILIME